MTSKVIQGHKRPLYGIQKILNSRSTNSAIFVQYSECLSNPVLATQMTNPFLNSRISANHNKGILANCEFPIPPNILLV